MLSTSGVPFLVKEPSVLLCAGWFLFYILRSALTNLRRDRRIAAIALSCLVGSVVTYWSVGVEGRMITTRYDLYIYRIDQALRFGEPGALLGKILLPHWWGLWLINFAYGLLSAAVMWTLILYEPLEEYWEAVYAFLICLAVAPLIYAAIPVSGPQFAFSSFPAMPAVIAPHVIHLRSAPNGVPSVHFSLALIIEWYARKWRWPFALAIAFLALTAIVTLASGQHYMLDLIAALPYSAWAIVAAKFLHGSAARNHGVVNV